MIVNDRKKDFEAVCRELGISKTEAGERAGLLRQNTRRVIEENVGITERYIALYEALGYDLEINYIYRGRNGR